MKKVIVILYFAFVAAMFLQSSMLTAQVPQKISYQTIIRNSTGELVKSSSVGVRISILQGSATGTETYKETHTTTTNVNGLATLEVGMGIPITGTFSAINWSNTPYFLKVETDPTGGTNYDVTGTSEILSTPYSLYSKKAETVETEIQDLADVAAINDSVNTQLKNVTDPTDAQDAATKAYVDALLARIEALEESDFLNNGFTDSRDDNHYNVVKIGNQIWMAENLKFLPSVDTGPSSQTTPYYYVYEYYGTVVADAKSTSNYTTYGVLYNWSAAMNGATSSTSNPSGVQGVCPTGWHLPSDAEWTELTDYLGGNSVAGGKMKEVGLTHWWEPNADATNETGFTALPGGYRYDYEGTFNNIGADIYFWGATEGVDAAWSRKLFYNDGNVHIVNNGKGVGNYVRCLKD